MPSARATIIKLLSQHLRETRSIDHFAYSEAAVWDVTAAAKGLTVFLVNGLVFPLPVDEGLARLILYQWAVDSRAN